MGAIGATFVSMSLEHYMQRDKPGGKYCSTTLGVMISCIMITYSLLFLLHKCIDCTDGGDVQDEHWFNIHDDDTEWIGIDNNRTYSVIVISVLSLFFILTSIYVFVFLAEIMNSVIFRPNTLCAENPLSTILKYGDTNLAN